MLDNKTTHRPGHDEPPPATLGALADETALLNPTASIIFPEGALSYQEFAGQTVQIARSLLALDIKRGDLVGLISHTTLKSLMMLVAITRIGAIAVPINPRLKPRERNYQIGHAGLGMLVVAQELAEPIADAYKQGKLPSDVRRLVCLDGDGVANDKAVLSTQEFMKVGHSLDQAEIARLEQQLDQLQPAVLLYTSGTVANPRGCLHSHGSLVEEGRQVAVRLSLSAADRFWTPLPIHHCGGIDALVACLAARCDLCHTGVFDPTTAINQLYQHRCTVAFPAFETIWLPILEHPTFDSAHLDALRLVVNVGTPERMRAMQAQLPNALQISCMGSTESNGFCCLGDLNDPIEARCTTSGIPLPHMETRVVNPETGIDCPPGTAGEFLFRGTSRFMAYHRDPAATAARIDADGWYHSKDLVRQDPQGRLSFICRMGDVLKVGGENVAAAEIEDYLLHHPSVRMAQVVPAPDARYGEVPAAFIEICPGTNVNEKELIDFCLGQIATFKVPRYVRFVDKWPMSGTKVQKFKLRDRLAAELKSAGIRQAPKMSSHNKDF